MVNVADVHPVHPLPQRQVTGGSLQPTRRNRNAERRQRRRMRQLQIGTTVCPTEVGREVQTGISSELRQMHGVRLWRPKREAHRACIFETTLPKCEVHQREGYPSFQRHETRVSTTRRRNEKTRVSQLSLIERDNQKCEVRVSAQQSHETHVLKAKRKSRACYVQRGLRVSEPCVSNSRRKGDSQKLKSPRNPRPISLIPLLRI